MRLRRRETDRLIDAVERVVADSNCNSCGACTLSSDRVSLAFDSRHGRLLPVVSPRREGDDDELEKETFNRSCPGVIQRAVRHRGVAWQEHEIFGEYLSVFQGAAVNPEHRFEGSSGGVLTAVSTWLLENKRVDVVLQVRMDSADPLRSVGTSSRDAGEVLVAAGSRYAPVSSTQSLLQAARSGLRIAFVGRPCEVSVVRRFIDSCPEAFGQQRPILLSFLCAGVPSEQATVSLLREHGVDPARLESLRYRGRGWPGNFSASDSSGSVELSYEHAWGTRLGRQLPWRCKLCVDGTGEDADIVSGDFWESDSLGYPTFESAEGVSAVIARTPVGAGVLEEARSDHAIELSPITMDELASVQPLQVERRITLFGRLLGRLGSMNRVPRYSGYGLARLAIKHPARNLRSALGTMRRSVAPGPMEGG